MLTRYVKGLPRYQMDCGWWRHPKYAGLSGDELFIVQAAIGYGNEHATDGWMPGDLEDLAVAIGVRLTMVRKASVALLKRGIWERRGDRLVVVGFGDHNPTSDEVEAHSEERRAQALLGNHVRWHKQRPNPSCPHCPRSPNESRHDPDTIAGAIPTRSPGESHVVEGRVCTNQSGLSLTPEEPPPAQSDAKRRTEEHPDQAVIDHIAVAIGWTSRSQRAQLVAIWDHGRAHLDAKHLEDILLRCTNAGSAIYLRRAVDNAIANVRKGA